MQSTGKFTDLVRIMDRLREECPWDRKQDFASLRRFLVEECFEAVDALDRRDLPALAEELGDLLLQVVFLSRLASEERAFDASDVVRGISDKLIRRHPHVFGDASADDAAEVEASWERIKREEKQRRGGEADRSELDSVPRAIPSLSQARLLGDRAARNGFDWPDSTGVRRKVREELDELGEAVDGGNEADVAEELGDLLFSTAMLARKLDLDPDAALAAANDKFRRRFGWMERRCRERGQALDGLSSEQWESLWEEAKGPADEGGRFRSP